MATEKQQTLTLTRRQFLLGLGTAGLSLAAARVYGSEEIKDSVDFALKRRAPEVSYAPPNPEELLPKEICDGIYDKLELEKRYPKTLNREAFHCISQRVSRLANWYFKPDKSQDSNGQEKSFYKFNEEFFQKILNLTDHMEVDFVATLLMWQVSGASTSSPRAYQQDIKDEQARVATSIAEDLLGEASGPLLVNSLRAVNTNESLSPFYYALPRVQGPVTLGIHDIETVMISRGLQDLKASLSNQWEENSVYLKNRSPHFFEKLDFYVDTYANFENLSKQITSDVRSSKDIQNYLGNYQEREKIRDFLIDGDRVDAYQLLRTTVFWANVSELSQTILIGAYQASPEVVEQLALAKTLDSYSVADGPTKFFLDQITNPKMIDKLKKDAALGNKVAGMLLEKAQKLTQASDQIIALDRKIAADIVDEGTELDVDFQLLTGVAYTRYLLRDAYAHTHENQSIQKIIFDNPDDLAFHVFLATANRESSPTYQLAGTRPLARATLTLLLPDIIYKTMDDFIANVYQKFEAKHPKEDYKTFAQYFLKLIEERYFPNMFGTPRYLLDGNPKIAKFIDASKQFGAYQSLITPPHCSWMRTPEATFGYIAEMA